MKAVLPIEIAMHSLRVIVESQILESEWAKAQQEERAMLDERRLRALNSDHIYDARISRDFNKKVKPRNLQENDLVFNEIIPEPREQLDSYPK